MPRNAEVKNAENNIQMPVLYSRLTPLRSDLHKDLRVVEENNFDFAKDINAIPIVLGEFEYIARHYPIVFAGDNPGVVLAVLGIKDGQNLFVDEKGCWKKDTYIPAYVRRYPFFIARMDKDSEPILCMDDTSKLLSGDGKISLFKDGRNSKDLDRMIHFTKSVQDQFEKTVEFVNALEGADLLNKNDAIFKKNGQVTVTVRGFKAIDRKKFEKTKATILKSWLGKGWLDASFLHFASTSNFDRLRVMHEAGA